MNAQTVNQLSQNFAIAYKRNNVVEFGTIECFYKFNNSYFCIVQKYIHKRPFSANNDIQTLLRSWFDICERSDEKEILEMNDILNKATYLENKEEIFFALCNELIEHD